MLNCINLAPVDVIQSTKGAPRALVLRSNVEEAVEEDEPSAPHTSSTHVEEDSLAASEFLSTSQVEAFATSHVEEKVCADSCVDVTSSAVQSHKKEDSASEDAIAVLVTIDATCPMSCRVRVRCKSAQATREMRADKGIMMS